MNARNARHPYRKRIAFLSALCSRAIARSDRVLCALRESESVRWDYDYHNCSAWPNVNDAGRHTSAKQFRRRVEGRESSLTLLIVRASGTASFLLHLFLFNLFAITHRLRSYVSVGFSLRERCACAPHVATFGGEELSKFAPTKKASLRGEMANNAGK